MLKQVHSIVLLLLFSSCLSFAQTVNISGVINTYTTVLSFDTCGNNRVLVASASGFAAGDRAMLIQMKGAAINTSNSSNFGFIDSLRSAGMFEMLTISAVTGDSVDFTQAILNNYQTQYNVQLVRVPTYVNAVVTDTLRPQAWNGSTGGVLAMELSGSLTLNSHIIANGRGYRGGALQNPTNSCNFSQNWTDYSYAVGNWRSSRKGEGIKDSIPGMELGRGALANGGGGANDHNSGGGGGGNYGRGGIGGRNNDPGSFTCKGYNPGDSGRAVPASNARIFMGGGGGAGHENNNLGSAGAKGGGIIYIAADTIFGNNRFIAANGDTALRGAQDGAGGGGAGGSVLLNVKTYSGTVNVQARGGKGGNAYNDQIARCFGPGGGGGGGNVLSTGISFPANVLTNVTGGAYGITYGSSSACNLSNNSAAAGDNGAVIFSRIVPQSFAPADPCTPLPVLWLSFHGVKEDGVVKLFWSTADEINNHLFEVQRSGDGHSFEAIGVVMGNGSSTEKHDYQFTDDQPLAGVSYYRLRQVDYDGNEDYSRLVAVSDEANANLLQTAVLYPNPAAAQSDIILRLPQSFENMWLKATDPLGRVTGEYFFVIPSGVQLRLNDYLDLPTGVSYLHLSAPGSRSAVFRLVKFQ